MENSCGKKKVFQRDGKKVSMTITLHRFCTAWKRGNKSELRKKTPRNMNRQTKQNRNVRHDFFWQTRAIRILSFWLWFTFWGAVFLKSLLFSRCHTFNSHRENTCWKWREKSAGVTVVFFIPLRRCWQNPPSTSELLSLKMMKLPIQLSSTCGLLSVGPQFWDKREGFLKT